MDKTQFINKKNIGYVNYLVNNTLGLTDLTKDDKKFIRFEVLDELFKKLGC